MNLEDACKVLGLPPTELPDERTLKKAYRKASLKHHPDRNLDDPVSAAKRFQKVGAAYQRIISGLHPDHGGSDYLAAQVNEAKAVLLGN